MLANDVLSNDSIDQDSDVIKTISSKIVFFIDSQFELKANTSLKTPYF